METRDSEKLSFHLKEVLNGNRRFENAAQSVSRMILQKGVEKTTRAGKTTYEFKFFREGPKHVVGWHEEINQFVNFIKNAAEGGPAAEQAFVLVGQPGNGKTFFADEVLCTGYRRFLAKPENRRYTIAFIGLGVLGTYGKLIRIPSDTFEDPLILAMNLCESREESMERLSTAGFSSKTLDEFYRWYRPLSPSTRHIWNDIRAHCDGDVEKMLDFVRVIPILTDDTSGTSTGKYSAGDKITSSKTDLLGKRDLSRLMQLEDSTNPYIYNVRMGALGRVAGGGIHFSDELFRNKTDLVQVYLQLIQNRTIELDGYRWPIDALIIATSNNDVYNEFVRESRESPVKDRCTICYVSHNTDYRLQRELTTYALGSGKKTTVTGDELHQDPNLVYALSVAMSLTRLPESDKLTAVEMMKLEAGESAGEKHVRDLLEIKTQLNANPDVTRRWGQKGIGHRGLGRIIQTMLTMSETHEGKCLFARDCFKATEREILDYIPEAVDRNKFMEDLADARKLYRREIKTSIFNAFREDPDAIRKDVMNYVNMIIGIDADQLGPDKTWRYRDPQTGEMKPIKIDDTFINAVETRVGLHTKEAKENFRKTIRQTYAQRRSTDTTWDFMDNETLVKAVTEVKLQSDVAGSASLAGALANRTNEENQQIYNRMVNVMFTVLGYCKTCAEKTIEYFIEPVDES